MFYLQTRYNEQLLKLQALNVQKAVIFKLLLLVTSKFHVYSPILRFAEAKSQEQSVFSNWHNTEKSFSVNSIMAKEVIYEYLI